MRVARSTGMASGLIVAALGIWAALIPFVGPYFHYGFVPDSAWHWATSRLWLDVLPGVALILGGITMFRAKTRTSGIVGSLLGLVGGGWLLLGSSVSLFWHGATVGIVHSGIGPPIGGPDRAAVEMIGFFYGAGALAVCLSGIAFGRFVSRPRLVAEPAGVTEPTVTEPATVREPATVGGRAPATAEPATTESATTESATTESATTESADTEPATTEPATREGAPVR